MRGLNTAATLWCSAAVGAVCGLGRLVYAVVVAAAVLLTNVVLRPIGYHIYPSREVGGEQEVTASWSSASVSWSVTTEPI